MVPYNVVKGVSKICVRYVSDNTTSELPFHGYAVIWVNYGNWTNHPGLHT